MGSKERSECMNEIELLRQMQHPHIISYLDCVLEASANCTLAIRLADPRVPSAPLQLRLPTQVERPCSSEASRLRRLWGSWGRRPDWHLRVHAGQRADASHGGGGAGRFGRSHKEDGRLGCYLARRASRMAIRDADRRCARLHARATRDAPRRQAGAWPPCWPLRPFLSQIASQSQPLSERAAPRPPQANVFVTAPHTMKLGDLGLGRYFSSKTEQTHSNVGTPFYMCARPPGARRLTLPVPMPLFLSARGPPRWHHSPRTGRPSACKGVATTSDRTFGA